MAIAKKIGCSYHQVYYYLRRLPKKEKQTAPPKEVAITRGQYLLIQQAQQGGFTIEQLASSLSAPAAVLELELAGFKRMPTRRINALRTLFESK
jgi:hypothetical protein